MSTLRIRKYLADPGNSEKLQLVPDQLDACISEKHFLSAVEILQEALRMIRKSDMDDIGALNDLRSYFSNQETVSLSMTRKYSY